MKQFKALAHSARQGSGKGSGGAFLWQGTPEVGLASRQGGSQGQREEGFVLSLFPTGGVERYLGEVGWPNNYPAGNYSQL